MGRHCLLKFKTFFYVGINILIVGFSAESVPSPDWRYEACRPKNCSTGPNISYPFQIVDDEKDFCGYPGFKVSCQGNKPVYTTSLSDYFIEDIFYENNSFRLVNVEVMNTACPAPLQNFSFDSSPFQFSPNFADLYLFYNCSDSLPVNYSQYPITCASNATYRSFAYLDIGTDNLSFSQVPCGLSVHAPVEIEKSQQDQVVKAMDYAKLLRSGFTLEWTGIISCAECKNSGGRCGFNDSRTLCFCPDRPHQRDCNDGSKRNLEAGIATGVSITGILMAVILFCYFRRYSFGAPMIFWKNKNEIHQDVEAILKNCGTLAPKRYSYSHVKKMTNSFKEKLGQGGYGGVYKGNLKNNIPIAVKVLNESKGNGEEFINEVTSISRTSHINIVSLLGFCFEGHKRALIYEFMPNGSLEKFISEENFSTGHQLGWDTLYQIAIGIARGLEYLHRGCNTRILHFDIKPHNILLDEDFCPKISDFGLAKLCPKKESIISMLGTRGTIGYIAPEVFSRNFGGVSHKSDVYSYGMMILEMAGVRKNVDVGVGHTSDIYFPDWIYKRLELNEDIGQHGIMNEDEHERARKMTIVGLWCIQIDPSSRPPMSRVVDMLEGSLESLQIPPKSFFSSPPSAPIDSSTTDNLALSSSNVCSQNHC